MFEHDESLRPVANPLSGLLWEWKTGSFSASVDEESRTSEFMVDHVSRKKILFFRNDEHDRSSDTYKSNYGSICSDWNWKFRNRRLVKRWGDSSRDDPHLKVDAIKGSAASRPSDVHPNEELSCS
ncbi:hypothetical protein EJ110_NYTH44659 [Nymphaea thermarum]|nr:hypothetical protein EJ110_NYTH44659 [Nymphaea thermarum]